MMRAKALVFLLLAAVAYGLREEVARRVSALLPQVGLPLALLLVGAAAVLLACAGLYWLRPELTAVGKGALAALDAVEARLAKLSPRRAALARALGSGLLVGALVAVLVEQTSLTRGLETRVYDFLFRLRFPERSQVELATGRAESSAQRQDSVVVLALDDETVAHLGWPIPRHHYARAIDAVAAVRPASLTFDISLVDPARDFPASDAAIGEAARRAGNVFFSFTIARSSGDARAARPEGALKALDANTLHWTPEAAGLPRFDEIIGGEVAPLPVIQPVASGAAGLAMANVLLDGGDDVLRHSLVVARLGKQLYPSLSLRVAAHALGVPLSSIRVHPGSHVELGGQRQVPIDVLGRTLVRYHGRHDTRGDGPFRYLSLWSILRTDATVTLAGNPLGEDQRFMLDAQTRLSPAVGGQAPLSAGTRVTGVARYSTDPGRILELAPAPAAAAAEPEFEVLDEETLRFTTTLASYRENAADLGALAGKHVLVGSTALAAADMRNGPLGSLPGVEHHATLLANILSADFFRPSPTWANVLVVLGSAFVAGLVGAAATPGAGLALSALLLLALFTAAYLLFAAAVHVPLIGPMLAASGSYLSCLVLGARATRLAQARAEGEREFVRRTFGRYLTEQVVEQLLGSPEGLRLGGRRSFVTIMMTDLRGFTSMCGTMEPENVVKLLNHYLETMTRIINRYGGTIDEFIGDAILVVFGAPVALDQEELRAAACATEMLNAMPEVNVWNVANGLPEVEMGIGIHSGEVVAGNIGSELRAKYGIVGATINLASRVESYTVGGQALLSDVTRQRGGEALLVGESQVVSPKGVKGTLTIHEVVGVGPPFSVKRHVAEEVLAPPVAPLSLRYATIKEKQVGELTHVAHVEALSALGLELRVDLELAKLTNLLLRISDGDALAPGDIYGKVLRSEVRPGVVYVRLTSVAPEARPVLAAARGEDQNPEPPLASA